MLKNAGTSVRHTRRKEFTCAPSDLGAMSRSVRTSSSSAKSFIDSHFTSRVDYDAWLAESSGTTPTSFIKSHFTSKAEYQEWVSSRCAIESDV